MIPDIGKRLESVVHRAGCGVPGMVAALPIATLEGWNPWIEVVADGQGGNLLRCAECGQLEGEAAQPARRKPEPIATRDQAIATYDRLHSERKAAKELGISPTQLRRLLGKER